MKWLMINPDHRKILIVDGKVAISGGINISKVYSGGLSGSKKVKGEQLPSVTQTFKLKDPLWPNFKSSFWTHGPSRRDRNYPDPTTTRR
jgi:cardiolipin synthase